MGISPTVFLCAPTFRETAKVEQFLESLTVVRYRPLCVLLVNACPGDATSQLIAREAMSVDYQLEEVAGDPREYWTGTINRALHVVLGRATPEDWVAVMNVDIRFDADVITQLLRRAEALGNCHVGALSHSGGRAVSSGVIVRSWALALNRHPYAGFDLDQIPPEPVGVDFLPSRCMMMPAAALHRCGPMTEKLPHYGADYEFSRRLAKLGCLAYLAPDVQIESDTGNTGHSVFKARSTFWRRFRQLWSVKNPANPWYRWSFIRLTYPVYAVPTAGLSYLGRTALEVLLGGDVLRRILPGRERGFSQ